MFEPTLVDTTVPSLAFCFAGASKLSIASGIAAAMHREGAELAFTYQGEAFGKRLEPLAQSVGSDFMVDVDVTDDASLDAAFEQLAARWPTIDFLVHAIAFSDKSELQGRILNTSRANFKNSLDISCYSLIDISRRAAPLMSEGGGIMVVDPAVEQDQINRLNAWRAERDSDAAAPFQSSAAE